MPHDLNGNLLPTSGVRGGEVQRSDEVFTSARPRGSINRPDFRDATPKEHRPLEVVHRGPVHRPFISHEQANTAAATAARSAQAGAAQAIDPEAFHALQVELKAQRELSARQARQIEVLVNRLHAIDGVPPEEAA